MHNAIYEGDEIDVISRDGLEKVKVLEIFDHKGEKKESAHGGTDKSWKIEFDKEIDGFSIFRKKKV